jgi:hypothetical protein
MHLVAPLILDNLGNSKAGAIAIKIKPDTVYAAI